ncbi:hypothetical protein GF367_01665 [Candidatus Woesearchaeota archaeon]|nr:hypothetical protein [Candidatus Woesearchaeota archaeon]
MMLSLAADRAQHVLKQRARALQGRIEPLTEAVKERQTFLVAFTRQIRAIIEEHQHPTVKRMKKDALIQRHKEHHFYKALKRLVKPLKRIDETLREHENELRQTNDSFTQHQFLQRLATIKQQEKACSGKGGTLGKALEQFIDLYELFHTDRNAFREFAKEARVVNNALDALNNLHIEALRLLNDLQNFITSVVGNKFDFKEPLTLKLPGTRKTILLDSSFFWTLSLDKKQYGSLNIDGRNNHQSIIPKSVRHETLSKGGRSLVNGKFYDYVRVQFGAKEQAIHVTDEGIEELYPYWHRSDKGKKESFDGFKRTADARILRYAKEHRDVLIITNDSEIWQTVKRSEGYFSLLTEVYRYEHGRLDRAA